MKKRILSLVLAIAMCFSMLSVVAVANDEAELMATIGGTVNIFRNRLWDWQSGQHEAMTDEQKDAIQAVWNAYNTDEMKEAVKAEAKALAEVLITDEVLAGEMMSDLYKWKLMRDMANGDVVDSITGESLTLDDGQFALDITSTDPSFDAWLENFASFEKANDEAISAANATGALEGLDGYSTKLTLEHFGPLATEYITFYNFGINMFEGKDAEKVDIYLRKAGDELNVPVDFTADDEAKFQVYLKNDVIELATEGMFNFFDLVMQIATFQIMEEGENATTGLFEQISDRDMKGAFLILGEEFSRKISDPDAMSKIMSELIGLNKGDLVQYMLGGQNEVDVFSFMKENNEAAVDAMYGSMKAASDYISENAVAGGQVEDNIEYVEDKYDLTAEMLSENITNYIDAAMNKIYSDPGVEKDALEIIHFNAYIGRNLLNYMIVDDSVEEPAMDEFVSEGLLKDAVFDGKEVGKIRLGYSHPRYPVVEDQLNIGKLLTYDINIADECEGIDVEMTEDAGIFDVAVTESANGTVKVDVFRGITNDTEENYLRYITSFTVTAQPSNIELVKVDTVDLNEGEGTIVVKAEKIDFNDVTVAVVELDADGNEVKTVYAVPHTKTELVNGVEIPAPAGAQAGSKYKVVVGAAGVEDEYEFTFVDVVLEEDSTVAIDEEIVIKGKTNLDNVTVAVVELDADDKEVKTVYAVPATKAELAAGVNVAVPAEAQVGSKYKVVVGTNVAADEYNVVITEKAVSADVTLDKVATVDLDESRGKLVVKGTTDLDNVTVAVVELDANGNDVKTVYAVPATKAELANGVEIPAIDGAQMGSQYKVVVGVTDVEDSYKFTFVDVVLVGKEELANATEVVIDNNIVVKGETNLDNVTVAVVELDAAGNEVKTVYAVPATKAELEAAEGIAVAVPAEAQVGSKYKVVVGTEAAEDFFYVVIKADTTPSYPTGGGGGRVYTTITVKIDEEAKVVVKAPTKATDVEFSGTGAGEVKLEIVDGNLVVTGIKEGTVKGAVKFKDAAGKVISTRYYEFIVTMGDKVSDHKCEWPDIHATANKDAHWAHSTIDTMTINGYIKGYDDGTFKPDQNITRAEFAAIVYRILGLEEAEDGVLYDDTVGHWAENIIGTMSLPEGYGMLRGYGDGNFGPNDHITREQAVAIIARAKSAVWVEAEENARDIFTDAEKISWWFNGELDAAVTNGLVTGYEDGSYKPQNFTTRAEACVLLARAWPEVLK